MILPGSFAASLVLLAFGMFCLGSWPNTFRKAGEKWRFELYYFDFAIGAMLAAAIAALTLGTLGFDGFSFIDDVLLAGKRHAFFAIIAGIVFNLANMLLLGAISVSGMAVAFPVGLGTAMIVDGILRYSFAAGGNLALVLLGVAATGAAIVVDAMVFRAHALSKLVEKMRQGKTKSTLKVVSSKAIVLSIAGGILIGSLYPLVNLARSGENGLGPYSLGFLFAAGMLFSTLVFSLFFINLPVEGEPADIGAYFRARMSLHGLGMLGGVLWYAGAVATFVAARAEGPAQVPPAVSYPLTQAAIVVGALWGIAAWKEFDSTDPGVRTWLGFVFVFLVAGIASFAANVFLGA